MAVTDPEKAKKILSNLTDFVKRYSKSFQAALISRDFKNIINLITQEQDWDSLIQSLRKLIENPYEVIGADKFLLDFKNFINEFKNFFGENLTKKHLLAQLKYLDNDIFYKGLIARYHYYLSREKYLRENSFIKKADFYKDASEIFKNKIIHYSKEIFTKHLELKLLRTEQEGRRDKKSYVFNEKEGAESVSTLQSSICDNIQNEVKQLKLSHQHIEPRFFRKWFESFLSALSTLKALITGYHYEKLIKKPIVDPYDPSPEERAEGETVADIIARSEKNSKQRFFYSPPNTTTCRDALAIVRLDKATLQAQLEVEGKPSSSFFSRRR